MCLKFHRNQSKSKIDENILEEKKENWNLNSIQGFLFCYELFFRKYISRETGL